MTHVLFLNTAAKKFLIARTAIIKYLHTNYLIASANLARKSVFYVTLVVKKIRLYTTVFYI